MVTRNPSTQHKALMLNHVLLTFLAAFSILPILLLILNSLKL